MVTTNVSPPWVRDLGRAGEGGLPAAGQLGVPAHLRDGHAGVAQAAQHLQPFQVLVAEPAVPARRAVDVIEQADPLVVAQGVEAEPGLLGSAVRK
jgi:hypothetical protein